MEDLQDVLEDVTYMNAMSDDSPKPTKPWEFPDDSTLKEFISREVEADPQLFSLEKVCENALGFYMFCKYCKANGDDAKARFLEEVVRYKRIMGDKGKASLASQVVKKYLLGPAKPLEQQKPDINESDLRRQPNTALSREEFQPLYEQAQAAGSSSGACLLKLGGPARDEVCDFVQREAEPLIQDLLEGQQSSSPSAKKAGKAEPAGSRRADNSTENTTEQRKDRKTGGDGGGPSEKTQVQGGSEVNAERPAQPDGQPGTTQPFPAPLSPPSKNSVFAGMIASNDHEDSTGEGEKTGSQPPAPGESGELSTSSNSHHTVTVEEESFFQRKQQKFPSTLFDRLEMMVWESVKHTHYDSFLSSPMFKQYQSFFYLSKKPVSEEDFTLFRVLGRGGFGQVNGCKRCQTGKLYAMKVMNKRRVKAHQSEKLCWNERKILSLVDSPFVVCLKYAFTSKEDLFLILDLMRGGDLAFHLDKRGRFTMEEARYFAARTLLGLQHLHKNGIVYRDLKPDNILMDERGKTRISDLGLACKVTPDLVGTYGTRGYWAPEMIMKDSKGHRIRYNQCVDWFSFGCVVYEMIVGFSPFRSEKIYEWSGLTKKDKHKVIDMAVIGMDPDFDRRYFDDDSIDLCKKLLEKDPRKRLGSRGSADVMAHPWFVRAGGVEWDVMIADAAEPPFVPNQDINAASQSAIGSFNDENQYRKMKIEESDHEIYQGWNWASQSTFFSEVVQFLKAEEVQGPIVPQQSNEGCCIIL